MPNEITPPEKSLPVSVYEEYLKHRRAVVMETAFMLEGLTYLRDANDAYTLDNVKQAADTLHGKMVELRLWWLRNMEQHISTAAAGHAYRRQFETLSAKHMDLINALRAGDLENDLIDEFMQEIADDMEMDWQSDQFEAVMRAQGVDMPTATAMIAALCGDHVGKNYREIVAKEFMRLAAHIANTTEQESA